MFSDLDLLAVGEIVSTISNEFDSYWNSDSAYPLELLEPDMAEKTRPNMTQATYQPSRYSLLLTPANRFTAIA